MKNQEALNTIIGGVSMINLSDVLKKRIEDKSAMLSKNMSFKPKR